MILSDRTIQTLLENGTLRISPLGPGQIQPASVDIRLGDTFSVVEDTSSGIVTLEKEISYKTIRSESYLLLPNQFVLATTMEYVELPDYLTAFVEGRSSLGRMGLFIQNAGWVDPGFRGEITLELYNANRCAIELKAGRRVPCTLTGGSTRARQAPPVPVCSWTRKRAHAEHFPYSLCAFAEKQDPKTRGVVLWFRGFDKAVTFSCDDGVETDRRLVELFNRYHLTPPV